MTERVRVLVVGCVAVVSLVSLASPAQSLEGAEWSAADSIAGVSIDSKVVPDRLEGPAETDSAAVPSGAADSLASAVESFAWPDSADDPAALAAWLGRLRDAASWLPESDRLVFEELVAAAGEMLQAGDSEAMRLLAEDALAMLRRGSP